MEKNSTLNSKNIVTSHKRLIKNASFLLFLAVGIGAFGAHGLEGKVSEKALETFKTGNFYHYTHAFGLIFLALISHSFNIQSKWVERLFYLGITLFSFCCYAYAVTGIKIFALIVPLGGTSFMIGWLLLGMISLRSRS